MVWKHLGLILMRKCHHGSELGSTQGPTSIALKWGLRNSLAVQWLGLHAFNDTAQVQSLVRELRSFKPWGADKKKEKIIESPPGVLVCR